MTTVADLEQDRRRALIDQAIQVLETELKTPQDSIKSWEDFRDHLILNFGNLTREHFGVYFVNQENQLISFEMLHQGTINSCEVSIREIFKRALAHNATSIILAHNHTSGSVDPSQEDDIITRDAIRAAALFDITVLDHGICSGTQTYSYALTGRLSKILKTVG